MKEFRDRVAVVTGAASGIGRRLAERFAAEGMKIVLADIEEDALRLAEAEFREKGADVLGVRTDVSKSEDLEKLAQQTLDAFGAVHTCCNIVDASRNRPAELARTVEAIPDAQREQMETMVRNFLKTGLQPSAVADQVLEAIRDNKLYIITHPEMDFIIRERFDNILARTNPTPRMLG